MKAAQLMVAYGTPTGRPSILVVEDEPILRMAAMDMVEDAGFDAVEATDATDAIGILIERADIRVVFTDIDMPRGLDGIRLAALIRDRWPPIGIIITSGYFRARDITLPPRAVFYEKPYREESVVAQMRAMVA